jgi:GntR family transcriptional repressor for pyruvate dehydrogenase complex
MSRRLAESDSPTDDPGGSTPSLAGGDLRLQAFRPVTVRKAADEVIAVIADAIRGGLYGPGDYLPRQADLAEQLEVSRMVVREAVEVLRRAGVVSVKRGNTGGVVVESTNGLPRVLASIGGETHASIRAALEARRPIETTVAVLVAERHDATALARLERLVDALETTRDAAEFLRVDTMFHYALGDFAESPLLGSFLRASLDQVVRATADFPVGRADQEQALKNQRRTLEAIKTGRPAGVRRAMDAHLAMLEEAYLGERLRFR